VSDEGIAPDGVGAATVDAKSEQYLELTDDEIRNYLDEADLLPDESE
jgi:proteasome alpha subunit